MSQECIVAGETDAPEIDDIDKCWGKQGCACYGIFGEDAL